MISVSYQLGTKHHLHRLTGIWSRHLVFELLDLFNQQGDVLQQVSVLQQQLMDPSLGLQPGRGLSTQLVLQQVDLQQDGSGGEVGQTKNRKTAH